MYSNEKGPGLNLKDILIKIVFVIIFILLLVWLFKINTPNMKPFYSNVFRENIKYMEEAAESYFTNDKLPKNIGDTVEMTLAEMIEEKLIIPFVDEDGKECDENASYVQVIKNKKDYTLKVKLVCPSEEDYTEKTLGCYDYCEDCDKEVTEYQYKQEVTTNKVSYSCPDGGKPKDGKCYVYNTTSYKATQNTGVSYTCPDGGDLDGTICRKENKVTYNAKVSYNGGYYYCPNGGNPSGNKCYVTNDNSYTYAAKASTTGGRTYAATKTTNRVNYLYNRTYEKPAGYTCSTSKEYTCSNIVLCPTLKTVYIGCYKNETTYSCPNGGNLSGTTCVVPGTTTYSCPNGGDLNGTTCYVRNVSNYSYNASHTGSSSSFYCDSSNHDLNNGICSYIDKKTYSATRETNKTTYDCPNGGDLNKTNKTCEVTKLTKTYNATKSTKAVKSYKYKWSTLESIEGWTRTGKTRVVNSEK